MNVSLNGICLLVQDDRPIAPSVKVPIFSERIRLGVVSAAEVPARARAAEGGHRYEDMYSYQIEFGPWHTGGRSFRQRQHFYDL